MLCCQLLDPWPTIDGRGCSTPEAESRADWEVDPGTGLSPRPTWRDGECRMCPCVEMVRGCHVAIASQSAVFRREQNFNHGWACLGMHGVIKRITHCVKSGSLQGADDGHRMPALTTLWCRHWWPVTDLSSSSLTTFARCTGTALSLPLDQPILHSVLGSVFRSAYFRLY